MSEELTNHLGKLGVWENAGFFMRFDNGYSVSVGFAPWHRCNNYDYEAISGYGESLSKIIDLHNDCANAEVIVYDPVGDLVTMPEFTDGEVGEYYTPDMLYKLMRKVRKMGKADEPKTDELAQLKQTVEALNVRIEKLESQQKFDFRLLGPNTR